jgi:hypothetical protein
MPREAELNRLKYWLSFPVQKTPERSGSFQTSCSATYRFVCRKCAATVLATCDPHASRGEGGLFHWPPDGWSRTGL